MNDDLKQYARKRLKEGLAMLNEKHHLLFKRMYSPGNLDADINDVVDNMPEEKLDWAMTQVIKTIEAQGF